MADITLDITVKDVDTNIQRFKDFADNAYPNWQEDYGVSTYKEFAELIIKNYLKRLVRKYENQQAINAISITDIELE